MVMTETINLKWEVWESAKVITEEMGERVDVKRRGVINSDVMISLEFFCVRDVANA